MKNNHYISLPMKRMILSLLVCFTFLSLCAREVDTDTLSTDTVAAELPVLSSLYYEESQFLTHNYNYELLNKQRRIRNQAIAVYSLGAALYGVAFLGGLNVTQGWSDWVAIPALTAVSMVFLGGGFLLAEYFNKKADALKVSSAYLIPVNSQKQIGFAHFTMTDCHERHAFGISIKSTF